MSLAKVIPVVQRAQCPILSFKFKEIYNCSHNTSCFRLKPTHILSFHNWDHIPENQPNYISQKYSNKNVKALFHQTDAESAFKIMSGNFAFKKSGPNRLFGEGYYFATNVSSTNRKARRKGIVLCCIVDLGRVFTAKKIYPNSTCKELMDKGYNTLFAPRGFYSNWNGGTHLNGDEYIITDDNQVLEGAWRCLDKKTEDKLALLIKDNKTNFVIHN